ncbi:MAG: hypothetical protein OXC61_08605 [Flavobacteriaceae bacterium]|nr:hypothetical protein [Flavobacteriaceae bacterium]
MAQQFGKHFDSVLHSMIDKQSNTLAERIHGKVQEVIKRDKRIVKR